MDSIGAEVGQKMRSAIKAKLMELNCYVDDELPDYIMVMVANKRTKSQMNDDLQLFLNTQTSTFVDWLHIVLKKLKEVTVTNPDVYKKSTKRKPNEPQGNFKVKKEKKEKKTKKDEELVSDNNFNVALDQAKSLTDDLPINANRLAEQRKIIVMNENRLNSASSLISDGFDIPLLSEVNKSNEKELKNIEKKIKNVKSRLGLLVDSDDDDEDCLNIKTEHEELFALPRDREDTNRTQARTVEIEEEEDVIPGNIAKSSEMESPFEKRAEHKRITFSNDEAYGKKPSVMDRLGKRPATDSSIEPKPQKTKINLSQFRKDEEDFFKQSKEPKKRDDSDDKSDKRNWKNKREENIIRKRLLGRDKKLSRAKESILSRLGVMSKVSVPQKEPEEPEEEFKGREVPSMVKIKPRVIPPDTPQANKNLLLKAVADAQRSIAQTPTVGNNVKPDALFTKKYKEKTLEERSSSRKLPTAEKNKLKNLITQTVLKEKQYPSEEDEYIPKPVKKASQETPEYVPSSTRHSSSDFENGEIKQQFIITLDGIVKTKFKDLDKHIDEAPKPSIKSRLDGRKTPSPIIFNKVLATTTTAKSKSNIPDKLPIAHPVSIKNKERCKYWPNCRQGDKCEFAHPSTNCDVFPHCKFGDKCLFIHPSCKFGSSCTKRDCVYSHNLTQKSVASRVITPTIPIKLAVQSLQTCKFFPNCTNMNCSFYHPKPCKFGKYCKNQGDCNFSHTFTPSKSSLTWRSK